MSKGNEVKTAALGMSHGTAANRLRKIILFSLVCRLKLNMCYRCDGEILSVGDLSIEHKEPWLQADDPVKSFFDLDNIAFSHLSCNSSAAARPRTKYFTEEEKRAARAQYDKKKHFNLPVAERQRRRREKYKCHGF